MIEASSQCSLDILFNVDNLKQWWSKAQKVFDWVTSKFDQTEFRVSQFHASIFTSSLRKVVQLEIRNWISETFQKVQNICLETGKRHSTGEESTLPIHPTQLRISAKLILSTAQLTQELKSWHYSKTFSTRKSGRWNFPQNL